MKNFFVSLLIATSFLSVAAYSQEALTSKPAYKLVVWADVSFDESSKLVNVVIPQKDQLPAPFVAYLMTSITSGDFAKPENAETNKQLESGLRVIVEIDPNTSKAKLLSQELMPRPTREEQQSEPVLRVQGDWSGRLLVTCSISKNGRCNKPRLDATANAPTEIPKLLQATLGSWRFIPQKRAGVAVDGEFSTWVTIEADTTRPPSSFDNRI